MARTQTYSIRDFSGGMVKGVSDRDLAPNEVADNKGFDNKKGTALVPLPTISSLHIARTAGQPTGYTLQKVPLGSYGCYGFGADHLLETSTPTTYSFASVVAQTGRKTKWVFDIDYDWNTSWSGTTWTIDADGYGSINTFVAETAGTHDTTYGWQLVINTSLTSCRDKINGQNKMDITATVTDAMDAPSGVSSSSPGTSSDDAELTIEADKQGSSYSGVEISIYSTTSNPPTE